MGKIAGKIAVFHDDGEVAGRIEALAAKAGCEIVRPDSVGALAAMLDDASIMAVVLDLVGRRSGGFELLEKIGAAPGKPAIIVVTELDNKTIESTRRLGQSKGLTLTVLRKDALDDTTLGQILFPARDAKGTFGIADLTDSIENYLRVEYQPKVPVHFSGIPDCGVEALCRMTHPKYGNVYPDQFIGLAERNGLIHKLTDTVACQAFRDLKTWITDGVSLRMAINISPELLNDSEWLDLFVRRCDEYEVDPKRITLEITESSSGAGHATALDILTRLRLKGFTLSIDDFGTGFSSLSTLYKLPFGELKIDKSFINDLQQSDEARAMVESTIGLAQRIGLKVVAEGVETEAILHELRQLGCHDVQGYFVSKALTADKIPDFFRQWQSKMNAQTPRARAPSALPKIAIIQSLLNDILSADEPDSDKTVVLGEFGAVQASDNEDETMEIARKIPSLVLAGHVTEALETCHRTAEHLEKKDARPELRAKLSELQSLLEREIACNKDIEILGAGGPVRLLPRKSATIGRPSSSSEVDIAVNCRWFSRGDKQLRISVRAGEWFVEDLGSTNGSSIGAQKLEPRRAYPLPIGETIVDVGKQQNAVSPISVRIRRAKANPGAVVVNLIADPERVKSAAQDGNWPTCDEDLNTTWIAFDDVVRVGKTPDCAFVIDRCDAEIAAEIRFSDGFRIAPQGGTKLVIEKSEFSRETPLPAPSAVSIGDIALTVREAPRGSDMEPVAKAIAANF